MSNNLRLRVNEQIRISPIRVIDHNKEMLGIIPTDEALRIARDNGLDLVEMSPNERPPVCRIMDYGKHKYQLSKKSKQKHHEQKIKEVRLRPKTEEHDLEVKLKHAKTFLEHGDRVLFTMLFRGRERFHQDMAAETFKEIVETFAEISKVDQPARQMGRRMTMVLAPVKIVAPKKAHKDDSAGGKDAPKKKKPAPPTTADAAPASPASGAPAPATAPAAAPEVSSNTAE